MAMTREKRIAARLEDARQELLDLSSRNRLIHAPRGRTRYRNIPITGERAGEVFRLLVRERRAMTFGAAATLLVPAQGELSDGELRPIPAEGAATSDAPPERENSSAIETSDEADAAIAPERASDPATAAHGPAEAMTPIADEAAPGEK